MSRTTRRIPSAAALVLAGALASCGPADTTKWQTLAPEGSGFTVTMPGTPQADRHIASGAPTAFDSSVYTLVLADGGFFTVSESRLPPSVDTKSGADTILDSASDHVVESASATATSRQTIYLSGSPGRRIEADVPESVVAGGGGSLYGRVYLANGRLYELAAVLPRGASTATSDRFFDSFQIKTP